MWQVRIKDSRPAQWCDVPLTAEADWYHAQLFVTWPGSTMTEVFNSFEVRIKRASMTGGEK